MRPFRGGSAYVRDYAQTYMHIDLKTFVVDNFTFHNLDLQCYQLLNKLFRS